MNQSDQSQSQSARQVAEAAVAFEEQRTGHRPESVHVVMSQNILVIAFSGSLSSAERALSKDPTGAARVREFHRELFASSCGPLREEIKRITGAAVREATAETDPDDGAAAAVFEAGTTVQVFLLADPVPTDVWSGNLRPGRIE
jgi:uncharacterized protein YbcI